MEEIYVPFPITFNSNLDHSSVLPAWSEDRLYTGRRLATNPFAIVLNKDRSCNNYTSGQRQTAFSGHWAIRSRLGVVESEKCTGLTCLCGAWWWWWRWWLVHCFEIDRDESRRGAELFNALTTYHSPYQCIVCMRMCVCLCAFFFAATIHRLQSHVFTYNLIASMYRGERSLRYCKGKKKEKQG